MTRLRPRTWLALAALLVAGPWLRTAGAQAVAPVVPTRAERARTERTTFLDMFARAYFPGRSGQIMVVPREGEILTRPGADVPFMHGSPWSYDTRIPMIFWGSRYVRPGRLTEAATQQDVAPTIAQAIGLPMPGVTGHALAAALRPGAPVPKAVVLLVLDAFRVDYLDRHAALLPNLSRLRREGASFERARVNHLPTITTVGHSTIATGTDARFHGIVANSSWDRIAGKVAEPFPHYSPQNLMTLALADRWMAETDGRAAVVAQSSTPSATALAGHGACLFNGRPVVYASYDMPTGKWATDAQCFRLPDYLKTADVRSLWEGTDGKWMGHPAANTDEIRRTAPFARFEGDALVSMIEREPIGADDVTDLVLANLKPVDYVGHAYGPDSAELRETVTEMDRQVGRVLEAVAAKAGPEGYLVVITADHGMPPEPAPGRARRYNIDMAKLIHDRFDPEAKLVTYYGAENGQIYIDETRARALGVSMAQIRDLLLTQPFILYSYTEDEVARVRLP
ncbi:MAG TPA: alkaline phosphatase family protein [Vicinamibacteria bacterium]|nr:alkaline phosphatase family protein [Vicinamibacteria bacterium]